ncbi:SDR family oxidoreductase [Bradyrhizobium sp. RDT10]
MYARAPSWECLTRSPRRASRILPNSRRSNSRVSNILVNAILPGPFQTQLTTPELRKRFEAGSPLHRVGRPEEIQGLALFLASPASSYVTGTHIVSRRRRAAGPRGLIASRRRFAGRQSARGFGMKVNALFHLSGPRHRGPWEQPPIGHSGEHRSNGYHFRAYQMKRTSCALRNCWRGSRDQCDLPHTLLLKSRQSGSGTTFRLTPICQFVFRTFCNAR